MSAFSSLAFKSDPCRERACRQVLWAAPMGWPKYKKGASLAFFTSAVKQCKLSGLKPFPLPCLVCLHKWQRWIANECSERMAVFALMAFKVNGKNTSTSIGTAIWITSHIYIREGNHRIGSLPQSVWVKKTVSQNEWLNFNDLTQK